MSGLPDRPSKLIAVHLNYRSRAAERGREPTNPSYFLKPPSTIAGDGDPVVRPAGCELLAFEGEIALVIGKPCHRVPREDAWAHVAAVTSANDFGVYDLRYADPGSNVHSKGFDGFTPVGPALLDAAGIDPGDLLLRTWVNGDLVQEALSAEDMIFDASFVVADLARMMTLVPGDLIILGTPTGSSVVQPGDEVAVEVSAAGLTTGKLTNPIDSSEEPLGPCGAMPVVDEKTLDAAYGSAGAR